MELLMKNILIITCIVLSGICLSLSRAESSSGSKIRVVRSDTEGVVVELRLSGFQTETIEHEGQSYQRIIVPDLVQSDRPGKPQVPVSGALIGIPAIDGVSLL